MDIRCCRHLCSPNIWTSAEAVEADVRLGEPHAGTPLADDMSRIDAACTARHALFGVFQPASDHPQAGGRADWLRLLAEIALALQSQARLPETRFHRVSATDDPDLFRVVIEARDHILAEECLRQAATILNAARAGNTPDLTHLHDRLVDLADEVCLGPSTMLIVRAAEARGIPWRRIGELSLVQFGHGSRQRRIWTAETDRTSAIAEGISRNKQLTKKFLDAAGVPVPHGRVVASAAEAWEAAQSVGLPVVVKPLDGNHGRGVFLNLTSREEIEAAFPVAAAEVRSGSAVLVEQFVPGIEHRLLVVGSRMVACARGEHLHVMGDGRKAVAELIELQLNNDPRRGRSETMPNKTVTIDATVLAQLAQEGVAPETVPAAGRSVLVKRNGSHGLDVTDQVHPEMAATAVRAARAVGLDIAGVDLVARDIGRPLAEQGARVCEVNAGPQLLIHSNPAAGPGQPVGEAIVAALFGGGETGRIPIAAVMGRQGFAAARLLDRWLHAAGHTTGLTCSDGKWVAGWQASAEPHATVDAARDLLLSPEIDAAVVELDWRSVGLRGLPTDRWNTLVLLPPPAGDSPSLQVIEAMIRAVAETGTIVVPDAVEPALLDLATRSGRTVITVTPVTATPEPRRTSRRIVVRDGTVVYEDETATTAVVPLADLMQTAASGTVAGRSAVDVEPAAMLAAIAAGISLALPLPDLRRGLLE